MTYGLVAIVRNEGQRIDAFLDAAMAVCDVATIVDTGSTDDTLERIRAHGIEPHRSEWRDFGTNRSEAFALARGTADWLLALDADMTVAVDDFDPDPDVAAYMVEMGNGGAIRWRLPLVLRGDLPWVSRGVVHEYTLLEDGTLGRREPTDAVRVTYPDGSSPAKSAWHAEMLEAAVARDPGDARSVFYLAQTYADLGDLAGARALYLRRVAMGGWDEETFVARYRAASLAPTWEQCSAELLAAWESRPHRLEPLYDLVHGLNVRGLHRSAYLLSDVVYPPTTTDVLFVAPGVWEWGLAHERGVAAGALGL